VGVHSLLIILRGDTDGYCSELSADSPKNDLDQIERDLRFHPVQNSSPSRLSGQQIEQFNRDGFLTPLPVYSRQEIDDIRKYFDDLLARVLQAGGDAYSISTAHLTYGRVYDILTERRILDYVGDLLGEKCHRLGISLFLQMPYDDRVVVWHQDASYWPLTPSKTVTVWLAIDDADLENGCMRFIAGSHHYGYLTYRPSSPEEHNILTQTVENAEQYGPIVENVLKGGRCPSTAICCCMDRWPIARPAVAAA
jgi:non-haem Fe2+, alpha-ketoglutarate-dependent halogenase